MAYTVLDRVYSIFIDVMTGVSSGNGNATFYNTDSHTSYIEVTVTNGVQPFNMTEYRYVLVIDKPNKQTYRNEYTTTDESKLVIEMDSQMLAGVGNNKGQLYIMKTTDNVAKVLTMVEFNYIVKEGNYSEIAPESTDHDALYVTLRNDVDNILQMIENGEIGGGSGGTGMTSTQRQQLATAYNHAMTDAVTTTAVVDSAIATYVEANRDTLKGDKGDRGDKGDTGAKGADGVKGDKGDKGDPFTYSDFTPEQLAALKGDKGDKGEKGDPGAKGEKGDTGATGAAGTNGKDGLTTAVSVNGNTYAHKAGTITLPNYPTKTSQLTNDSSFATETYVTTKIAEASLSGGEVDLSGYAKITDLPTKTSQLANDSGFITAIPSEYVTEAEVGTAVSSYVTEHKSELKGDPGEKGDTGAKGDKGDPGAKGDTGATGAKGDKGDPFTYEDFTVEQLAALKGAKGDKGDKGDTGATGADGKTPSITIGTVTTGAAGTNASATITGTTPNLTLSMTIPQGAKGDKGDTGATGAKGDKGDTGATGAKGDKGDPFTYADFTSEQLAALKGAKGDKGDPGATGAKGDKGDTGAKGDKGDTGATPNIVIGTVTTGEAGTNASATITGTTPNLTLSMTIPKGAKGDTGATGAKGDKGEKGDTGAKGDKGADGITPTLSIGTVTTGAAGSSANVTMGGTAPSYVLNFTIPKGDKGDKGDTGASGSGSSGGSSNAGIVFENTYVSDANLWLTNGYTKTSGTATANLPDVCTNVKDRWGILFFIAENESNGSGTQMFFPVDGAYMGRVFTRSVINGNGAIRTGEWTMLSTESSTIEAVNNIIMKREAKLTKVEYASSVEITDIRSYIDVTGDITITLPSYSNWYSHPNSFTCEHHIYMKFTNAHTVTFADTIKWQSVPTVKAGTVIDFIFNFIHYGTTNFWLGGAVVYE